MVLHVLRRHLCHDHRSFAEFHAHRLFGNSSYQARASADIITLVLTRPVADVTYDDDGVCNRYG